MSENDILLNFLKFAFNPFSIPVMIFINKHSDDPRFNLAAEEFVLKQSKEEVFMLWKSHESVVIGKHQLAWQEADQELLELESVPLLRRITGGGTVYHGPGNICFSFITEEKTDKINFPKFAEPIILYLKSIGLEAEVSGKSNISIDGLKISGNAASVHRNRSLHHGTLLFDADIHRLNYLLQSPQTKLLSKAVSSVRTEVRTIKNLLPEMNSDTFFEELKSFISAYFDIREERDFAITEKEAVQKLADEKYASFDWNYGYSPDFIVESELNIEGRIEKISVSVKQGKVSAVDYIRPDVSPLMNTFAESLLKLPYGRISFRNAMLKRGISEPRMHAYYTQLIEKL